MRYITLPNSSLNVSKICLGTMTFGEQNTQTEANSQLNYAVEQGINFIDTAEMYPVPPKATTVHETEKMVGNWLKQQQREKLVLATKVTGDGRNMNWIRDGAHAFNRKNIRSAIDGSLRRLNTDYIDLYQLHWPERNTPMFGDYIFEPEKEHAYTPIHETLEALSELVDEGKVRNIGLSNEWPWGLMQFLNASEQYQLPRVVSMQNAYSLLNRTYETALLEMCHREQISLLAYSPLAFGHLSGKYASNPHADGRITLFKSFGQRYEKPGVYPAVKAYAQLAEEYHLTPAQLALGFVYSRQFVASTIIGATSLEQLSENINALAVNWTADLEEAINKIHLKHFIPAP